MPCLKFLQRRRLNWFNEPDSNNTGQAVPKGCTAVTKAIFYVISSGKRDRFAYRVPQEQFDSFGFINLDVRY